MFYSNSIQFCSLCIFPICVFWSCSEFDHPICPSCMWAYQEVRFVGALTDIFWNANVLATSPVHTLHYYNWLQTPHYPEVHWKRMDGCSTILSCFMVFPFCSQVSFPFAFLISKLHSKAVTPWVQRVSALITSHVNIKSHINSNSLVIVKNKKLSHDIHQDWFTAQNRTKINSFHQGSQSHF